MTKKLSPQIKSKVMSMYFQGKTETEIANKLKIDQSTVSKLKGKFKALVGKEGIKKASEEYGVAEEVEALHTLSMELSESHSTIEEAKAGLKMDQLFQENGISQDEYPDCVKAIKRMKEEGFIQAAIKLKKLEDSTEMTYDAIVTGAANEYQQLQKCQQEMQKLAGELVATKSKLIAGKKELADMDEQKEKVGKALKTYMHS